MKGLHRWLRTNRNYGKTDFCQKDKMNNKWDDHKYTGGPMKWAIVSAENLSQPDNGYAVKI